MYSDVRIGYLVDHPEALPGLERLFQASGPPITALLAREMHARTSWLIQIAVMEVVQYDGEATSIYEKTL
jgi:hypothetical protein